MHSRIIGAGYLVVSLLVFFFALVLAVVLHVELETSGIQFISPQAFSISSLFHGQFMLFGVLLPAMIGFVLYFSPTLLVRQNNYLVSANYFLFVLYFLSLIILLVGMIFAFNADISYSGFFIEPMARDSSAYKITEGARLLCCYVLLFIAVNLILMILLTRDKQTSIYKMSPLLWSVLLITFVSVVPLLLYCLTQSALYSDLIFGSISDSASNQPGLANDPWYLSHYTMLWFLLFLFGLNTQIFNFACDIQKYNVWVTIALITMAICISVTWGFEVYLEHRLQTGQFLGQRGLNEVRAALMVLSGFIYVVSIVPQILAMTTGKLRIGPHVIFIFASYLFLLVGGFQGAMLATAPADFQYHDTWYVNSHSHFMLFGGVVFALFGGAYTVLSQWKKNIIVDIIGYSHCGLSMLIAFLLFILYGIVGLEGLPRRIPDYNQMFSLHNEVIAKLSYLLVSSQVLLILAIIVTAFAKKREQERH